MNKIIVEVSIGELFDKISILEIKKEKIKDPEKLKYITDEHSILKSQLNKNIKSNEKIEKLFQSLKEINSKISLLLKKFLSNFSFFCLTISITFLNKDSPILLACELELLDDIS